MVSRRGTRRFRRRKPEGYNLVALVILVAVLNVAVAAVLPKVSQALQREREEELIFRGLQYAEAIRVFQVRHGRYPVRLEELIEIQPRSIRQLWRDPMDTDRPWGLIRAAAPGQSGIPGGVVGGVVGGSGLDVGEDEDEDEEDRAGAAISRQERLIRSRGRGGVGDTEGTGPITGVHSLSEKKAIKSFAGGESYKDWRFTVDLLPTGAVTGENVPRMNAAWVGRPLPAGVEPGDAEEIQEEPTRPRRRRDRGGGG